MNDPKEKKPSPDDTAPHYPLDIDPEDSVPEINAPDTPKSPYVAWIDGDGDPD